MMSANLAGRLSNKLVFLGRDLLYVSLPLEHNRWGAGRSEPWKGRAALPPGSRAPTPSLSIVGSPLIDSRAIGLLLRVDFPEHPHDLPPRFWMHREEVDDVGPVLTALIAGPHQS